MPSQSAQIADALRQLSESDLLRDLENRLAAQNAFNLFDAIGVSNQELRHSDFLAFLLRPNEAHGLGDGFLKWFLCHALAHSPAPPISPDAVAAWDLSDADVGREPDNIDLLIKSTKNRLAVIIENKIRTGEHSDQLSRYMQVARAQGHGGIGDTLLGVYLTPHGGKSSHAEYLPIGYEAVCTELERLCKINAFSNATSTDVEVVVRHYNKMLKKTNIVIDPKIQELCAQIYANHKVAIDAVNKSLKPVGLRPTGSAILDSAVSAVWDYFRINDGDIPIKKQQIVDDLSAEGRSVNSTKNAIKHMEKPEVALLSRVVDRSSGNHTFLYKRGKEFFSLERGQ